ncbi:ABC-F family ATP-binding cassette domain-containing protein [Lactobacillaceae bacterium L1_55_11]|nr:ABC-F family ATP-binding cassette domain-containing protein [Lactobacillaceae bacterium L1_55_11]
MKQFRVENLTSSYGEKTLFKDLSFLINEGDRVGLVGVNGSGKTTLLNAIAGVTPADQGQIITQNDYRVGYLTQSPDLPDKDLVMDAVLSGDQPVFKTIRRYQQALQNFSDHPDDDQAAKHFQSAQDAMDSEDAWTVDAQIKTILMQLHMPDLQRPIAKLSGGQKKRVGLAQILIQEPDLLILDEPTNHLDFDSIAWLEKYLAHYPGSVLTVTHDRYFLDAVSNRIFELAHGKLYEYQGNYQDYVSSKAERLAQSQTQAHKQERLYQQELAWMKKSARARTTKQKGRQNAFEKLAEERGPAEQTETVSVQLGQQRLGKKVFVVEDASLKRGQQVILDDFNLRIGPGDRIGITGANGAGKSTLLNVLAGRLPLDSGTVERGETVKLAYYTQVTEPIDEDKRVIEYLSEVASTVTDKNGRQTSVSELLEQFLFPPFMHGTLIRKLSGGEKRRLYLLKLLMQQPNVLFLDEPTNDLDIETLTVLENFLEDFAGTVVTVSHDRYFLDKVANQTYLFQGEGRIKRLDGQFSQHLDEILATPDQATNPANQNAKASPAKPTPTKAAPAKPRLSYQEKREWASIEDEMADLEEKAASLNEAMTKQGSDYVKLAELQDELDQVNADLEQKLERWTYLSEIVEAAGQ